MATWVLSINFTCIFHSELLNSFEKHMRDLRTGAREGQMYQILGLQQMQDLWTICGGAHMCGECKLKENLTRQRLGAVSPPQ